MPVAIKSTGGGSVTLTAPSTASDLTLTLPSATGTVATTTGTLTNPTINGLTGDTSVINVGSGQFYKDTSGNVGIGTSSGGYGDLTVRRSATTSTNTTLSLVSGSIGYGRLFFGNTQNAAGEYDGFIQYDQANRLMQFGTAQNERARIDSSGSFILTAAGNINLNTLNTYTASGNGYQKLPSGIIIQWGKSSAISTGSNATITFPIAFPSGCWVVLNSLELASGSNSFGVSHGNPSTTSVVLYSNGAVTAPQTWIAIGN